MGWLWAPVTPQSRDLEIILSDFWILVFWYSRDSGGTWTVIHNPALCSVSKPELVFLFTPCLVPTCLCLHWEITVASELKLFRVFSGSQSVKIICSFIDFFPQVYFFFNCKHHLNLYSTACAALYLAEMPVWFGGVWKCFVESGKWWVEGKKSV